MFILAEFFWMKSEKIRHLLGISSYAPSPPPSPPKTGERAGVRGKDKKENSYTIKL
jgi:hypothetical protein